MKQSYFLSNQIIFLDICECHLLPYYRTLDINTNNNIENLTVMAVLYLYDYGYDNVICRKFIYWQQWIFSNFQPPYNFLATLAYDFILATFQQPNPENFSLATKCLFQQPSGRYACGTKIKLPTSLQRDVGNIFEAKI